MGVKTYGSMQVDWEDRLDIPGLRTERLERLKAYLDKSDVGALLTFDFDNIRYMTGTHIGTWAKDKLIRFAVLAKGAEPALWDFGSAAKHHAMYCGWLENKHGGAGISTLRGAITPPDHQAMDVAKKIQGYLADAGVPKGPVGVDIIEMPVLHALQSLGIEVVDGQQIFLEARKIKTANEIGLLTHSASLVDAAYEELFSFLKPGVREDAAVGVVANSLYSNGSEHVEGVNSISGERTSPHPHVFSDRMMRPGDPAFFDILHSYQGYRTCYYRTFHIGSATQAQKDAYKKCREILDVAIAMIKPGVSTADVVSVWPKAEEFGFPNEEAAFALQYGHGIGLSIWEKPVFSRFISFDNPEILEEGMVFAVETYWPSKDGWSASRIEEELIITADGCECITKFPAEELLIAGTPFYSVSGPLTMTRDSQSHLNTPEGRGETL